MIITHNVIATNAAMNLDNNNNKLQKNLEKLSSGYKINRAADDAAGLAISEQMRRQIHGLEQGHQNIKEGIGYIQVGDGAMQEIHSMLRRMITLSTEAANGTMNDDARNDIDLEMQQLKKEINRISDATEYAGQKVFDNDDPQLFVSGSLKDVSVFNANYDKTTGEVSYGGIVVNGARYRFDSDNMKITTTVNGQQVDSYMVRTDANGKQVFNGGDYDFSNLNGVSLHFHCEDGAEIPEMTRTISISANASGITIDGKQMSWSELKDEDGNSCTGSNIKPGFWSLNYSGADITFFMPEGTNSLQDVINNINTTQTGSETYTWETEYDHQEQETAVQALLKNSTVTVSQSIAKNMQNGATSVYSISCDKKGIRLLENGTPVQGSEKEWKALDVDDPGDDSSDSSKQNQEWDSGAHILNGKTFTYSYSTGKTELPEIKFSFQLSDVTSAQSVIDGLDGVQIILADPQTHYAATISKNNPDDKAIESLNGKANIDLSFTDELALGRDFDKSQGYSQTGKVNTTSGSNRVDIVFPDQNKKTGGIKFTGEMSNNIDDLTAKLKDCWNELKTQAGYNAITGRTVTAGKDPSTTAEDLADLAKIVSDNNDTTTEITTSGYFSENVTIPSNPTAISNEAASLDKKATYHGAKIDFRNVNSLTDLLGSGFDSTCATCDKHYSIRFTDGTNGNYQSDAQGYKFKMSDDGTNYLLDIDVTSLTANGVTTSGQNGTTSLASAIVKLVNDSHMDFHYQQYVADGSTLYVFDNRPDVDATASTFSTAPYIPDSTQSFALSLEYNQQNQIDLNYTYNFSNIKSVIKANMQSVSDTTDNTVHYYVQDSGKNSYHSATADELNNSNVTKYKVEYSFSKDKTATTYASENEALRAAVRDDIIDALNHTDITLSSKGQTTAELNMQENSNVAIRPYFDNNIIVKESDNYIQIQHSATADDFTRIPRFAMNTGVLNIYNTNCRTIDNASKAISHIQKAIDYVSAKRAIYGANQNRLEYAIKANEIRNENETSAESQIRDTDMATEMAKFSKNSVISQASMAMLAQANQSTQSVLKILQ